MTLLENHLEQISLSSTAIAELPFPPPKIFTNALLHSHDITTVIRDTEAHERALFTLAPSDQISTSRRSTFHGLKSNGEPVNSSGLVRVPKHGTTVATLLGAELGEQIRKGRTSDGKEKGEVDVEILLQGAERLCHVYPIRGAPERIASLRSRYEQLHSSIARYESRLSKQTAQLSKMNRPKDYNGDANNGEEDNCGDDDDDEGSPEAPTAFGEVRVTAEDLRREEDEIRELEKKKRGLQDRVSGMERDLGGLLR